MSVSRDLAHYTALLQIRRAAGRRDVMVIGVVFLVTSLATLAMGLLGRLQDRSVYIVVAVEVALGLGLVTAWVRMEISKALLELIEHVQRAAEER